MQKKRIAFEDIYASGPHYSRGVRAGNMLFISGCTARGTEAQGGPPIDQLKAILDRITRIVSAEGGTPRDIVKVTTFVTNMKDWYPVPEEQRALIAQHFQGENPATSLVEASALAEPGLDIEIEAIALLD